MKTQRQLFFQHIAQTSDFPLGLEIESAEGVWMYSKDNKYLDLISGIGVSNLGHRHPKVVKAIKEQEVQSRVDKAATLINDSSKTIYTFLGPIATAVTAFYFSGLGSSSKTNDENSENERNE